MNFMLDWKSMGSMIATLMFIRTAIRNFLPPELYQVLQQFFAKYLFTFRSKPITIVIDEFGNSYGTPNEIFEHVQVYLSSKQQCLASVTSFQLFKCKNSKNSTFTMTENQHMEETFQGIKVTWSFHSKEKKSVTAYSRNMENRYFELEFHPKYLEKVNSLYLPHVMKEAEEIMFKNRERKLYTNKRIYDNGRQWSSVPFMHPSTFDTIAIDPILKEEIKGDLVKFVSQQEFYTRVGRSWKRGYLLYGPPGTGKTSLIAAIANFLEFDIYDLELTAVGNNSELRKLLISTPSRSIIVVEDIDCSLDLSDRKKKNRGPLECKNMEKMSKTRFNLLSSTVSLSGVLNFIDGLWSSCGGERLIIFTTNHKDKLDPALLRPGRMDKHINLSFCGFPAFKTLAKNYLDIDEDDLMNEANEILSSLNITPADVAELFMSCRENHEKMGMKHVIEQMKERLLVAGKATETNGGIEEEISVENNIGSEHHSSDAESNSKKRSITRKTPAVGIKKRYVVQA